MEHGIGASNQMTDTPKLTTIQRYCWRRDDGSLVLCEPYPTSREADQVSVGTVHPVGREVDLALGTALKMQIGRLYQVTVAGDGSQVTLLIKEVPYRDAMESPKRPVIRPKVKPKP